jgi:hypothetical protein
VIAGAVAQVRVRLEGACQVATGGTSAPTHVVHDRLFRRIASSTAIQSVDNTRLTAISARYYRCFVVLGPDMHLGEAHQD